MRKNRQKTLSSYHDQVSRILGRSEIYQKPIKTQKPQVERLTFTDIQNITRSMIKDKKAHSNNMGVITNIKGKMYCLKLGEVSKPKDFSFYFYSTQYRKKASSEYKPTRVW